VIVPAPVAGLIDHVTLWFGPVTEALNACDWFAARLAV